MTTHPPIERARAFDPDAWEELFRRTHPRLHAYARRRLASDHEADDAVAETMARAVSGIERFEEGEAGIDGWLFGICRNVLREQHRHRRRDSRWELVGGDLVGAAPAGPLDTVVHDEDRRRLVAAFALLSPDDRDVLELRVTAGLDAESVGLALGKTAGAVRMAQARALRRLRDLLGR